MKTRLTLSGTTCTVETRPQGRWIRAMEYRKPPMREDDVRELAAVLRRRGFEVEVMK